jgi:hypothetical protein
LCGGIASYATNTIIPTRVVGYKLSLGLGLGFFFSPKNEHMTIPDFPKSSFSLSFTRSSYSLPPTTDKKVDNEDKRLRKDKERRDKGKAQ